jgi:phosphoribosylglycinamide formyltransferase-1
MKKLAVLASGRGSNFRAILDHERMGVLRNVEVTLLLTNDGAAPAIQVANERSIPSASIEGVFGKRFSSKEERAAARRRFDEEAVQLLRSHRIDLVALAGFMQVLTTPVLEAYRFRIMNIHPAVDLKRFGGRGMFGERVHEAVLNAGEKVSGCSVHYVDDTVDGGPIIIQSRVPIEPSDNAEILAERILTHEHRTYSKAIQLHVDERIKLENGTVVIDWSGGWEEEWNRRQVAFIRHQSEQSAQQERFIQSST